MPTAAIRLDSQAISVLILLLTGNRSCPPRRRRQPRREPHRHRCPSVVSLVCWTTLRRTPKPAALRSRPSALLPLRALQRWRRAVGTPAGDGGAARVNKVTPGRWRCPGYRLVCPCEAVHLLWPFARAAMGADFLPRRSERPEVLAARDLAGLLALQSPAG